MKKTYMAPVTEEQKIELSNIICLSGTLDNTKTITDQNGIGARRNYNVWGDDDSEGEE